MLGIVYSKKIIRETACCEFLLSLGFVIQGLYDIATCLKSERLSDNELLRCRFMTQGSQGVV